jgi:hypothetical protein
MSGNFKLAINLGEDAMKDPAHVAEALREVATHIEEMIPVGSVSEKKNIMDDNGNTVGSWTYFNEGEDEDDE